MSVTTCDVRSDQHPETSRIDESQPSKVDDDLGDVRVLDRMQSLLQLRYPRQIQLTVEVDDGRPLLLLGSQGEGPHVWNVDAAPLMTCFTYITYSSCIVHDRRSGNQPILGSMSVTRSATAPEPLRSRRFPPVAPGYRMFDTRHIRVETEIAARTHSARG